MSPIADRSIIVRIGATVTGLVNGLKTADKAAQDWGNKSLAYIQKNEQSINTLSNSLGVMGAALTGVAVLAVKSFADFDAAMSSVQASTMETADNMELLRAAAIDAGARTVYSATEAAGAIEELAKAGVSTADILAGGLDGALDLAASGAIGVGEAAEIAASTMTQFGLKGEDVTHIADVLAASAGKAQGGVTDMGNAMKYVGVPAAQLGVSMEQTAGAIALFASNGIIGEQAGTSLRSMISSLTSPSQVAKKQMAELGISVFDAAGNFIGLDGVAGQLQSRLGSLTQAERANALGRIFGNEALQAANVLTKEGADGVREWTAAVDDQGYAAEQAAIRMDNLKGDIEGLTGSLETAFINMGEGANGPLRSIVQGLDRVVDGFNGLSNGAQQATLWLIGGAGLVTLGIAGLGRLATASANVITSLQTMGIISQATAGRMGALALSAVKMAGAAVGIAAVAFGVGKLVDALNSGEAALNLEQMTKQLEAVAKTGDIRWINRAFTDFGETLGMATVDVKDFGEAMEQSFRPSVTDKVAGFFDGIPGVTGYMERLEERFVGVDEALAGMVSSGNLTQAYQAFREIRQEAEAQGIPLDELREKFPQYMEAVGGLTAEVESATPAQDAYNDALGEGGASADLYAGALEEALKAQKEQSDHLLTARDAMREFESAIDDAAQALADNGATLDISTEKGRENEAALDGIARAGLDATEKLRENGGTQEELQGQMQRTRDEFIKAAGAFGMSAAEAEALADQMGLIPENVTPTVAINDQASGVLDNLWTKITRLPDRTVTVNVNTMENTVTTGRGNTIARARGGILPGAPSSVDNMMIHAASGEFVVNARATSKNRGVLEAINSGQTVQGLADGGYVGRQYVAPQMYQQPAGSPGSAGSSLSLFEGGTIIAADPRAAVKELRSEVRLSMVGSGM